MYEVEIFHSNLDSKFGFEFQTKIIETASRLHNYILDEEQACFNTQNNDSDRVSLEEWGVETMPNRDLQETTVIRERPTKKKTLLMIFQMKVPHPDVKQL